jgi:hypothetical protein
MRKIWHAHFIVTKVPLPSVGPTMLDLQLARAKRRLDTLCIPAWEPYARFPRPHTNVAKTWEDRG